MRQVDEIVEQMIERPVATPTAIAGLRRRTRQRHRRRVRAVTAVGVVLVGAGGTLAISSIRDQTERREMVTLETSPLADDDRTGVPNEFGPKATFEPILGEREILGDALSEIDGEISEGRPGGNAETEGFAPLILHDGIALYAMPEFPPSQASSGLPTEVWELAFVHSGRDLDLMLTEYEQDARAGEFVGAGTSNGLPQISVGFGVDSVTDEVVIYGVVPPSTRRVTLESAGGLNVQTQNVFVREQVDRAVFITYADSSTFSGLTPDSLFVTVEGEDFSFGPTKLDVLGMTYGVSTGDAEAERWINLFPLNLPVVQGELMMAMLPSTSMCPGQTETSVEIGPMSVFPTAEKALVGLLDAEGSSTFLRSGYFAIAADEGLLGYAVTRPQEFEPGSSSDPWVTVVAISQVPGGWQVTGVESSAC